MTRQAPARGQLYYAGLCLLLCLFWGVGNPVIKLGIVNTPPFLYLAIRYALAVGLFLLIFGRRCFEGLQTAHRPTLALSCLTMVYSFASANLGLFLTTATNASFLMGMSVLFTPFLQPLLGGGRFDRRALLPLPLTVAGLYLLCGMTGLPRLGAGEWLALSSSVAGAASMVLSARVLGVMTSVSLAFVQSAAAGVCCLALSLLTEGLPQFSVMALSDWLAICFVAVFCTVLACLLQNTALMNLDTSYVALLQCSEPVFSAAASFLLLGERLTLRGWIGAALLLAAMVMASLRQDRGEDSPSVPSEQA
ncbi:MAG: DMT family transporter [Clostridia bacterium]|nr:DMT family transporter [Clostridia bacterium]